MGAANVRGTVTGSEVTLSGSVHSCAECGLATNSAWGALGVHGVVDRLVITN